MHQIRDRLAAVKRRLSVLRHDLAADLLVIIVTVATVAPFTRRWIDIPRVMVAAWGHRLKACKLAGDARMDALVLATRDAPDDAPPSQRPREVLDLGIGLDDLEPADSTRQTDPIPPPPEPSEHAIGGAS